MEKESIKTTRHSRRFLSGIPTALKTQGGDPRQQHSGMTSHGFTLIEMLVTVLIVGILAAIALPQYQHAVRKARYVEVTSVVDALYEAEEEYWLAHRRYTDDLNELSIKIPMRRFSSSYTPSSFYLKNGLGYIALMDFDKEGWSSEHGCEGGGCTAGYIMGVCGACKANYIRVPAHTRSKVAPWSNSRGKRYCIPRDGNPKGIALCSSLGELDPEARPNWYRLR